MSNWWQNLNMSPQERKFVIVVVVLFAIVLNFLFIWPQFGKWTPVQAEITAKKALLAEYEAKIDEMPKLKKAMSSLESTNSAPLLVAGDAKTHFSRTVENLARQNRFLYDSLSSPTQNLNSTNKYFQELTMRVNFSGTQESDLVNFLYKLSDGNSSIRVREFSIKPNNPPMLLQGFITLVANYEVEKPSERPVPSPAATKTTNLTAKTP